MAQHDYVIANGTGAAVRSDLNNALAAIVSQNSGATEPATMYAYQWWADTTTGLLKLRNGANNAWIVLRELDGTLTIEDGTASSPGLAFADDLNTGVFSPGADQVAFTAGGTARLTATTTGITSALPVDVPLGSASAPTVTFTGDLNTGIYSPGADQVAVATNGTGRLFIDSSGRVLVGTSSIAGIASNSLVIAKGGNHIVDTGRGQLSVVTSSAQAADVGGSIALGGQSTDPDWAYATIAGRSENNGYAGYFSVATATSGGVIAERMRISQAGHVNIGKTAYTSVGTNGHTFEAGGLAHHSVSSDAPLNLNRNTNDGNLVTLYQDGTLEGVISVSGTTVTYGGGHLARWSQLPNDEDPTDLLKGTVMSNLDEMCEWGGEDNEQLNKTKVSDVEGDPNAAGVFVSTSFSDDGPLDFFVGMTGDMIIRIAEGVTVQRGDLLMSAGDGTAKPQDDDIIRSKTIAKVTSTNVSCTYDDGSYCVPCVLMAC